MSGQDQTQSPDDAIAAALANIAGAQPNSGNELLPTPIGVPKYKVDPNTGEILKDASGKPIPWYVQRDVGQQVPTPATATSMIPANSSGSTAALKVPPKYWSHDAWTLIDGRSAEDVYTVQKELIDAGLLKPKGVVAGNWTNAEANAFTQVLSQANANGETWDVTLGRMAANGRANPAPTQTVQRPALEIQKANPFALRQVADKAAETMIGRRLTDAEANRFVEWWGQQEDAANNEKVAVANAEANDQMVSGGDVKDTGGGVLGSIRSQVLGAPPPTPTQQVNVGVHTLHDQMTPDEAAQQFIQQQNASEVSQTQAMTTMNNFLQFLGSSPSGGMPGRQGG